MKKSSSTTLICEDSFLFDLNQFSSSKKFWIAFSGGMDSCVLLHLFYINKTRIEQDIEVLYVNHGLQDEADEWGKFCQNQCQQYGFSFRQLNVAEDCPKGESVENWAREKRYSLFKETMNENDVLFTAHHQDDQVETFFLQALRGAGPRGLSAMPVVKIDSNIIHARLLLDYSRNDLKAYAAQNKLVWQDDNSNLDKRYDRNYFRHVLAPVIEERWPAYRETISRLVDNQRQAKLLLDELAASDLKLAQSNKKNSLDLVSVKKLSAERQKNLLFFWLKQLNLMLPDSKNMENILSNVICSAVDKSPCVNWKDVEVRRYKNLLYAEKRIPEHDINVEYPWSPEEVLNIENELLVAKPDQGKGISKKKLKNAALVIRYRQGGEKIHPDGSVHSTTVKQLFQECSVLPWMRDKVPLIYVNNDLAMIPGFCIDKDYTANKDESSWDIHWTGYNKVLQ